jgi:hypothetical protein
MHEHCVRRSPIRQVEALTRERAAEQVPLNQPAIGSFSGEEPRLPELDMPVSGPGTIATDG